MNKIFKKLSIYLDKAMAFETASTLFSWDEETLAPKDASKLTSKVLGILADSYFNILINDDVKSLMKKLQEPSVQLTLTYTEKSIVKELEKTYETLEHIPPNEYRQYHELLAVSGRKWSQAKKDNNYKDFAPVLEQIIDTQKKFAGYRANAREETPNLYDVLLNDYEEGFNIAKLDGFFDLIKSEIVPLLKQVTEKQNDINKDFNFLSYDIDKQKEFSKFISEYVGFDFNKGVIAESAHPFTTNLHNHDVRITTHYNENNLESAIFSTIHEAGHAVYEMNIADELTQTLVGHGASMGIHESQSRFFENIIGRDIAFWQPIYDKLINTFPEQLQNIDLEYFIKAINKAEPSLIRTEADELSYSLHVLIRYEIEKMIFNNEVRVEVLPDLWNEKYEEYMGIKPSNDTEGVLQDTHWALGSFGYFPSYAIGSAIAAQIYYYIKEQIPFDIHLKEGDLSPIISFLNDNIHKFGKTKTTDQFLFDMMGEEFNAEYYIKYLKEKYNKLYNL
ncbi:MAG TPA: carboxypeptidase M32 [Clostridiales bacterium]|nr:carboxypeptidase M32 [Clostridiales bacterium]